MDNKRMENPGYFYFEENKRMENKNGKQTKCSFCAKQKQKQK